MALINDKNRKWIIAGVSVVLMLAFIPNYINQKEQKHPRDISVGTLYGGEMLSEAEVRTAAAELDMLSKFTREGAQFPVAVSILAGEDRFTIFTGRDEGYGRLQTAYIAIQLMTKQPEVFALLVREAQKNQIAVDRDRVETILRNQMGFSDATNPATLAEWRAAVTSLVLVQTAADVGAEALKVTRPDLQSRIARVYQSLNLRVAEFGASDYAGGPTSAPAAQAAPGGSDLYAKFKDKLAGAVSPQNPFGFGYKLPDRVRLEYVSVTKGELLRAVAAKSPSEHPTGDVAYDWSVAAHQYYDANRSQFLRQVPTTSAAPTLDGSAIMVKELQKYEEVERAILSKLQEQKADQLRAQVVRRIAGMMAVDFKAFAAAPAKPSSLGAAYDKFEYLRKLADKVEADTGVRPVVTTLGDRYQSQAELAKVPDFTTAKSELGISLVPYVFHFARPLVAADAQLPSDPLELCQPSPAFADEVGGVHIVRVTDALLQRVPAESEVAAQVAQDAATQASQERALAARRAFKDADAGKPLAGRRIIPVQALRLATDVPAELGLSPYSKDVVLTEAYNLLRGDAQAEHPRAVIDLPADRKVLVAELGDVQALIPGGQPAELELASMQQLRAGGRIEFAQRFLDPAAVIARTNFKSVKDATKKQ